MPLIHSSSEEAHSKNVAELIRAGHKPAQANAIAYRVGGEDEEPRIAASVLFVLPDGRVLLLKRSPAEGNFKEHWSLPGGKAEDGESARGAAMRETAEETGRRPDVLRLIATATTPTGMAHHTFVSPVDEEFAPTLNAEHTEHAWADPAKLPSPLHPAVKELLAPRRAADALALDAESTRTIDADGRLHVSKSPISKANVCEYRGVEIPDAEKLGLDPAKKYRLLRHPDELKKGAATFDRLPILSRHVPMDASTHDPELVIGATGETADFDDPYLTNGLVFWKEGDVDDIEEGREKELSCAYRYRADMTPGTFRGEAYDGVMRDIVGNHVAKVRRGRAGPDVVVGDSLEDKEIHDMTQKNVLLSRKAAVALGCLVGYLKPKLAMDAQIDWAPVLGDVTGKNFSEKKTSIVKALKAQLKGKLAADANLEDMHELLDSLDRTEPAEAADAESARANAEGEEDEGALDAEEEAYERARDAMEKAGCDAKEVEAYDAAFRGARDRRRAHDARRRMGRDETPEEEKARKDKEKVGEDKRKAARDAKRARDAAPEKKPEGVDRKAMDAAIGAAEKRATASAIGAQKSIRAAEKFVDRWVGALDGEFDSETDVYRAALDVLEADYDKSAHPSALKSILMAQPVPGEHRPRRMAADSADASFLETLCPDAARIVVM